MGFLKWIKRELDTPGSCKRRQSEPPIVFGALNSNTTRDESYVRAISKFNEWRSRHRFNSNARPVSRKLNKKQLNKLIAKGDKISAIENSDHNVLNPHLSFNSLDVQNNGIYEEICTGIVPANTERNISCRIHSLPTTESFHSSHLHQQYNKPTQTSQLHVCDNDEIYDFEKNPCVVKDIFDSNAIEYLTTPPRPFYRENSNPFSNIQSPRKCNFDYNPTHSVKTHKSPCMYTKHSQRNRKHHQRDAFSYNNNDHHHNKHHFLPDVLSTHKQNKGDKNSQLYQTIINNKGEEVEYAVPLSEKLNSFTSPQYMSECGNHVCNCITSVQNPNPIRINKENVPEPLKTQSKTDTIKLHSQSLPCNSIFDFTGRRNVKVTDLDKSDGTQHNTSEPLKGEILRELNSLEMWSKNISLEEGQDNKSQNSSLNGTLGSNSVITHESEIEVPGDASHQFNEKSTPIFLSFGYFRKMNVSKFYIRHPEKLIVETALQHNFLVMRKIRHPHISLLMASGTTANHKLTSLILEPFRCTLKNLIDESGDKISSDNCIDYAKQICKAAMYMHENGLIHSNISSHAVFVCNSNNVKLSSFELTTFSNNRLKEEILSSFNDNTVNMNKLPRKYLPYYVEYRKIFSQHFYQSPELITANKKFLFPSIQTDVYGITLTLWEMLNCKTPFVQFSYTEMEKIFSLRQAQLPNFKPGRCEKFEKILDCGLRINIDERIKDVEQLYILLKDVNGTLGIDDQILINFNGTQKNDDTGGKKSDLSPTLLRPFGSKTSTIKRRKKLKTPFNGRPLVKQLFENVSEKETIKIPPKESKAKEKTEHKGGYQFEIDQFSLPDTPIARNNKIRKTVWLTNKTISPLSPINHNCENFVIQSGNGNSTSVHPTTLKRYNLNITIIQNEINNRTSGKTQSDVLNSPNIQSQINYWNTLTSPGPEKSAVVHSEEKSDKYTDPGITSTKINEAIHQSCNKSIFEENVGVAFEDTQKQEKPKINYDYYPSMPELLSETFRKKNRTTDEDFIKVFWRREKEKCEQTNTRDIEENGVLTPRRTSVKEAVSKFEKISSKAQKGSSAIKDDNESVRFKNNTLRKKLFVPLPKDFEKLENNKETQNYESKNDGKRRKGMHKENCTMNSHSSNKKIDKPQNMVRLTTARTAINNITLSQQEQMRRDTRMMDEKRSNISKLEVILRSDPERERRKMHSNPELDQLNSQNDEIMSREQISTNTKSVNLFRSASDIGCESHRIVQATGQFGAAATVRHSIGETEILSRHEKITLFNRQINFQNLVPKLQAYTENSRSFFTNLVSRNPNPKLYPHIKCKECGSNNIAISGRIKRPYLAFPDSSPEGSLIDIYGKPSTSPVIASIEDLYIDDDILKREPAKLGPNLTLNATPESLSPDELDISSKEFDPSIFNFTTISSEYMKSDDSIVSNQNSKHK